MVLSGWHIFRANPTIQPRVINTGSNVINVWSFGEKSDHMIKKMAKLGLKQISMLCYCF